MRVRGAYMTIKEFLYTSRQGIVYTEKGNGAQDSWHLEAKRELVIPDYQREYRWEDKQLAELISDIGKGQCYLGQIAVARNASEPQRYYLVDGQQRITSIIILLTVLVRQFYLNNDTLNIERYELHLPQNNKDGAGLPRLSFVANCFDDFQEFLSQIYKISDTDFGKDCFSPPQKDSYHQAGRYINACVVSHNEVLRRMNLETNKAEQIEYVKELIGKILSTQISVVIFDGNNSYESERVFLDINEKGLRLDNEDILKAYYFQIISEDTGAEALNTWQALKEAYFCLKEELSINKIPLESFVNFSLQIELLMTNTVHDYTKFDNDLRYKDTNGKKHICELFTDTHLHLSMQKIVLLLKDITALLQNDSNSSVYRQYLGNRDSTTREIFKLLFTAICKSGMTIIYIALIKFWWLKQRDGLSLTLEDIIQLFSFYIISNVSGVKKERLLFSNNFISSQTEDATYQNLHISEIRMLKDAFSNATTLKSDLDKGEYLSFNIQMFFNDFKFSKTKNCWELTINNQEFLSKYSANREKYIKDHFLIQNAKQVQLLNDNNFAITRSMSQLRKRAYNFVYHFDDFGNVDFVIRLNKIGNMINRINEDAKSKGIEPILPYGQYELEYFDFIKRELRNYFDIDNTLTDDRAWEASIIRYKLVVPGQFSRIVSYILEEKIYSWNQKVCSSFSEQFPDELVELSENS